MIVSTAPFVAGHRLAKRFIDVTSRQRRRAWSDPASGERRYLPDA